MALMTPTEEEESSYAYVCIPWDETRPLREARHRKNTTLEDDDLRDVLKAHFESSHALTVEQRESLVKDLRASHDLEEAQLRRVAEVVSVETYPLTVPTKQSFVAVSLYADAKAAAKDLPLNRRANSLAASCGAPSQQFRGDIFASRYFDDDDEWLRRDLLLSDLDSSAEWIVAARNRPSARTDMKDIYSKLGGENDAVTVDAREAEREAMTAVRRESDGAVWSQTSDDVELRVDLPPGTHKRSIRVALSRGALTVAASEVTLLSIPQLYAAVDSDALTWFLDDNQLVVALDKLHPSSSPWPSLHAASSS